MSVAGRALRLNARVLRPPFARVPASPPRQRHECLLHLLTYSPPSRGFSISHGRHIAEAAAPPTYPTRKPSFLRRAFGFTAIAIFFTGTGFVLSAFPAFEAVNGVLHAPSDEETLRMYAPENDFAREVENHINNHPLAGELRSMPQYSESRPHLKMPPKSKSRSLTSEILMGPGKVVVPPFAWSEDGGKSLVTISYLGTDLCGHPGIVHGGLLATLLDEGLARCCFAALPNKVGVTARLLINYRAPVPEGSYVVLRATTTKVEGRKAWVEGRLESLVAEGEKPIVYAEASALFIEPRRVASITKIFPVK